MDELKIAKFLKERREELGLTQKDVADKVHVSNKTISKWENGRGLFDVTMLKPLSKVLKVSITELVTGELSSEKDFKIKTDDAFNITFQYMNKKVRKIKLKTILYTIIIPILLFVVCNISYKIYLLNRYHIKIDKKIVDVLNKKPNVITASKDQMKNTHKLDEYVRYDEVAFINNYKDYELVKPEGKYRWESYKFVKRDSNNNVVSMFWFSPKSIYSQIDIMDNITKEGNINSDNAKDYILTRKDVKRLLLDHNIDNDVDLIKYLRNNYYFKSNIFTSIKNIKERYSLNKLAEMLPAMHYDITYIEGKYEGYIINMKNVSERFSNVRSLYLIVNNKVYVFEFYGDELTTDEYIKEFIETVNIDMLSWQFIDNSTN